MTFQQWTGIPVYREQRRFLEAHPGLLDMRFDALAVLRGQQLITEWHRGKVIPGQVVNTEVTKHLNAAGIILLFISPDYRANEECVYEMRRAIERHILRTATVIPVLLRPVAMLEEAPFAHIQGFPRNGRPISEFGNRKGSIFVEIANEISAIVCKFR